ncbi:hypothetical protein GUJ93_ZPchr0011g28579 [Zizania palustris]|uniref:Uncharacterized protein n=1 Tax=Zizania palustris TaxID=103762 RepID=A0A8J6BUB1_ZIZPA|nr:hypothetical protein GUJ93_ZPchr0011g28579 [Zizania palustris]
MVPVLNMPVDAVDAWEAWPAPPSPEPAAEQQQQAINYRGVQASRSSACFRSSVAICPQVTEDELLRDPTEASQIVPVTDNSTVGNAEA